MTPDYLKRVRQIARIKGMVYEAGLTFTQIERDNGLCRGAIYDCVNRHVSPKNEQILADALGVELHKVFPLRYDKSNRRLARLNRAPIKAVDQRRNVAGAQT